MAVHLEITTEIIKTMVIVRIMEILTSPIPVVSFLPTLKWIKCELIPSDVFNHFYKGRQF